MYDAKENLEIIKDLTQKGYENARALSEIQLRAWENMVEKQLEVVDVWTAVSTKQFELATAVKDVKDLKDVAAKQTELAKELGETLAAKGRETVELAKEAGDEYRGWLESSVGEFTTEVKKAGEKAVKAAKTVSKAA